MRLDTFTLAALAFTTPACAQYFSAGWTPGQAVPAEAPSAPSYEPETTPSPLPPKRSAESPFSLSYLLSSGPFSQLFDRLGINISERLEAAEADLELWDKRVPLVTDENYNDLVVNEVLTSEEEKDRVWFLIITAASGKSSSLSLYADKQFDDAYNTTLIENDLPNVRWGRIDYMTVTYVTTKWGVWRPPVLVAVSDRGKTLRFWRATQIRLRAESLREFLKSGMWQHTPPWQTAFAPGGNRELFMEWQAIIMTKAYNALRVIPRWALYVVTGALGSVLMNFFHRGDNRGTAKTDTAPPTNAQAKVAGSSTAVAPSASTATPTKGKGKKGKK